MRGQGKLLTGVIMGAGAMYLLDPDRGPRRRSLLRDQGIHVGHKLGDGLAATARDTRNRTLGVTAQVRRRLSRQQPDDEVLHDRVRSSLGRLVSHPGAITVTAFEGGVTLGGHVLEHELDRLLKAVGRVPGVREVQNELEIHRSAEGVSSLQGSEMESESGAEGARGNWPPATRLAIGALGSLAALQGSRTRGFQGQVLSLVGVGLVARAAVNLSARRFIRLSPGGRAITVEKTLLVGAPVDRVWELWSNFESFPRFMAHLREVRKIEEGRSHWVAVGPAGVPVEWEAIVTDWVPGQFIGWRSVESSPVETSGQVRLRPVSDRETQIDVQLTYTPPAGGAGQALASLLGADPKRAMDEDLRRLKSLLEKQQASVGEETIHLQEVAGSAKAPGRTKKASPRKK
ncbi:MAG: SRPBCC family protein [Gemmatimonadales bacterium]